MAYCCAIVQSVRACAAMPFDTYICIYMGLLCCKEHRLTRCSSHQKKAILPKITTLVIAKSSASSLIQTNIDYYVINSCETNEISLFWCKIANFQAGLERNILSGTWILKIKLSKGGHKLTLIKLGFFADINGHLRKRNINYKSTRPDTLQRLIFRDLLLVITHFWHFVPLHYRICY